MKYILLCVSCAGSAAIEAQTLPPPPPDEAALIALLPSGMELVTEIDVAQLRGWDAAGRLRALPREVALPVEQIDELAIGVAALGTDAAESTLIVRGRLAELPRSASSVDGSYHGHKLFTDGGQSMGWLGERTACLGAPSEVRRCVDGGGAMLEPLVGHALARLPTAKAGRPAVRLGVLVGPALRQRAQGAGIPVALTALVDWIGVVCAVGDGIDVGLVVGTRMPDRVDQQVHLALARLSALPSVRALGVSPLLAKVKSGRTADELHLAWRLDGRQLARLLDSVGVAWQLARRAEHD